MLSKVKSMAVLGINAYVVEVEVDLSTGIPSFDIVAWVIQKLRKQETE